MAILAIVLDIAATLRETPSNRNQAQWHEEDSLACPT
jgi:hypothetical protein